GHQQGSEAARLLAAGVGPRPARPGRLPGAPRRGALGGQPGRGAALGPRRLRTEDLVSTQLETGYPVSSTEFLATVAARELAGKHRVFAGVGLPTLAVDLAKRTVNPGIQLIYESGVCGAHPEGMAEGIADSVLVSGAEAVVN